VDARSLVPIIAIAILAAKNYYIDGRIPQTFSVVTKAQFLGVVAGFLSNRVAILLTEIKNELRVEDFLSIVPGSLAEAYRYIYVYIDLHIFMCIISTCKRFYIHLFVCICIHIYM
jgi:hypothetical protein